MATLTADQIFEQYLWPLYPEDARDLTRVRTADANPAGNPRLLAHLDDAATVFEGMAGGLFGDDRQLQLDRTDASVHRLSVLLTRERRDLWGSRGAVGTAGNELFNVIVHASAYVGSCIVTQHAGCWAMRRPMWESAVRLESRAGVAELSVLQWVLKSLADPTEGVSMATLADRYRAHVEVPCLEPNALPQLFLQPREVPRLAKVRYHTLHQHLRAHVPELRDLGEHFPSAERFDALRFEWLEFVIVGGGRMLLLFGPGQGGMHLVWLTGAGFEKSAYVPADSFPAPILKIEGEKLRLLLSIDGKKVVEEMLWWGP